MGLLAAPLNWGNQTVIDLHVTLVKAYNSTQRAEGITAMAELAAGTFPANAANMLEAWKDLLDVLANQGKLRALVEKARDDATAAGFQAIFIQVLDRDANPVEQILNEQVLSDRILLLNRTGLRQQLRLLESDREPVKVLIVRGESGSGKTHGRYLFERVAQERGAQPVYMADGLVATVDEVIYHLYSAQEASERIPPNFTTSPAYYRAACNRLKEVTATKKQPLWIAMDQLGVDKDGAPLIDPEIKLFFDQFTMLMSSPDFRRWFRLMLIHYPDNAKEPTLWPQEIWHEDRTSCADITQEHVVAHLKMWLAARGLTMIDDDVSKHAQEVIARGDGDAARRLRVIHDALLEKIGKLGGGTG